MLCLIFTLRREVTMMRGGQTDRARLREYAGYGLPVALSLILALVISSTDRFLLAAFLDEEAVGVYHAGYSLANRTLDVMFIWLGMAGGPVMVQALERGGRTALAETAREQSSFMVLLTLPAAVGVALVAGPLAQVMVGEALVEGAAQVTPWIAIGAFFSGVTTYYLHQAFTLGQRTKLLSVAMTIPAGLNLALTPQYDGNRFLIEHQWQEASVRLAGNLVDGVLCRAQQGQALRVAAMRRHLGNEHQLVDEAPKRVAVVVEQAAVADGQAHRRAVQA
jgi:O-antigen/teichoic acid export membrane protein